MGLRLGLIVGVRKSKEVREGEKGKKGVDVTTKREGNCLLVSCADGREDVVGFGVECEAMTRRGRKNEKKPLKLGTSGG